MKLSQLLSYVPYAFALLALHGCGGGTQSASDPQSASKQAYSVAAPLDGSDAIATEKMSPAKNCGETNSNGTNAVANCSDSDYAVTGSVTGLMPGEKITVLNNESDALTISGNSAFSFPTRLSKNDKYAVMVSSQPGHGICTISNGSGFGVSANINNVRVICSRESYEISGTIAGLASGTEVTLLNNGTNPIKINENGRFHFSLPVARGSSSRVTVAFQPNRQVCTVQNGSAVNVVANITNVVVECSTATYQIAGTVAGLASDAQVTLLNNGADPQTITSNGAFSFTTPIAYKGSYAVTVGTQPVGQVCTVLLGTGSNVEGRISNISVTCVASTTPGVVTGCREITSSGNYALLADVTAPSGYVSACIYVHDTANVQFDCANNMVTGAPPIAIANVQNFSVTNCTFQTIGVPNLDITKSNIGNFSNNTYFGVGTTFTYVNVSGTNNLVFNNNTITGN